MLATFVFIVAMFITMALIPPLMKTATRLSIIDMPDARKVHTTPMPRVGGIAMVAGAVTPILFWGDKPESVLAFLLGVGVILVFGVWDDRRPLTHRIKFIGQAMAVAIVVFYGHVYIRYVPFYNSEPIPYWMSIALTFFALLGTTNAINLADGLDGLAGGTTFMSIAAIALLAFMVGDTTLLMLATAVMGSIVGFLRFNTHPAQVFMGDAGSQFLGFTAGVLVVVLTQQSAPTLSPAIPLLLLGLPILDTFIVMGQRIFEGRSPFKPDRNHLHHKLLSLGYDHYESVVLIYAAQALLVTAGVYFRYASDGFNLALYAGFSVATIGLFQLAKKSEWRAHRRIVGDAPMSPLTARLVALKRRGILSIYPRVFIATSVPLYIAYAIWSAGDIPYDAAITVFVMLGIAFAYLVIARGRINIGLVERLIICTTITAAVYYYVTNRLVDVGAWSLETSFFVALTAALIIAYRFSQRQDFRVTPMDFLVIFAVMVVPNLMGVKLVTGNIGEVAAKSVILYYAAELIISQSARKEWGIRTATTGVLAAFTVKALWF